MVIGAFEYSLKTKVIFGQQSVGRVPEEANRLGASRALVVTDPGVAGSGFLDEVLSVLAGQDIPYTVYDQVTPNPTTEVIAAANDIRAAQYCDVIIALGGGSTIDTAKSVAILATSGGNIEEFAGPGRVSVPPAPVIALPTTAGTGAEVSTAVAVTRASDRSKFAIRGPLVSPTVAILDPDLLRSLPKAVAIDTGMDALSHLLESYVSKGATPMTDVLAMDGIERCGAWLTAFVADRSNAHAAQNMLYAAMLGGIVISQARTGAVHTLTRPMGDQVTHGLANAVLLPHVMEFNLMAATQKFIRIAHALGRPPHGTDMSAAREAVTAVREICTVFNIPKRLRDIGIADTEIESLAHKAYQLETSRLNPHRLEEQDIRHLLEVAY